MRRSRFRFWLLLAVVATAWCGSTGSRFASIHRAWADGGVVIFIPPSAKDIADGIKASYIDEPEQQALLHFDGKIETLYLSVRYEGNVSEFGWIIPVPGVPKVELSEVGLIHEIAEFDYQVEVDGWRTGRFRSFGILSLGGGSTGGVSKGPKPEAVHVLERKRVGLFDVAVLEAADPDALKGWLDEHSFQVPDTEDARSILRHYVDQKMYFCALRVAAGEKASTRWLNPITIQFPTPQPFYPLRISALHARPKAKSLVVLHTLLPVDSLSFTGKERSSFRWSDARERLFNERDLPVCHKTFPDLQDRSYTLTTFSRSRLTGPQMKDAWFATTEEQLRWVEAERAWNELGKVEDWPNSAAYEDQLRAYLADHSGTPYGVRAAQRLARLYPKGAVASAKRMLKNIESNSRRIDDYRKAILSCRRAGRIAPELGLEVTALERRLLAAEAQRLGEVWQVLELEKQELAQGSGGKRYLEQLVAVFKLCLDIDRRRSIFSRALKREYLKQCAAEIQWLHARHPQDFNAKLTATLEDVRWYLRWNSVRAERGRKLLEVMAPTLAIQRKVEALDARMRRGFR